tara:strand:- start:520 stop:3105 length:2586 start_codon:yes stop_codon:yes gene_type:complete
MADPFKHGQMMNYLTRPSEDKKRMRDYFETNDPIEFGKEVMKRAVPIDQIDVPLTKNITLGMNPGVSGLNIGGAFDVGGGQLSMGGGISGDQKAFGIGFRKEFNDGGRIGFADGTDFTKIFGRKLLNKLSQERFGLNFKDLPTEKNDPKREVGNFRRRILKYQNFIKENNRQPTQFEARSLGSKDRAKTIAQTDKPEVTEKDIRNKLIQDKKKAKLFKGKLIFADENIQNEFENELKKRYSVARTSGKAKDLGVLSDKEIYDKFLKPAGYKPESTRTFISNYKKILDQDFKPLTKAEKDAGKVLTEEEKILSQGGKRISGTTLNPNHHLFPIGDNIQAKAQDFTVIPQEVNSQIQDANKQLRELVRQRRRILFEIRPGVDADRAVNVKNLDIELKNINKQAEEVIKNHYKRYPKHEGLLNFKKLDIILDDQGRLLMERGQPVVRQIGTLGGDYTKWTLANVDKTILNKNIVSLSKNELRDYRSAIKDVSVARDAGDITRGASTEAAAILKSEMTQDLGKLKSQMAQDLGKLGCPTVKFALGGRVKFNQGSACVIQGREKLESILKKAGKASPQDQVLARGILKAGQGLKNAFALRGLLGPAAIAFTTLTEGGIVGYDMLSQGKTLKEAMGDSVFNLMLGDDYKFNNDFMSAGGTFDERLDKLRFNSQQKQVINNFRSYVREADALGQAQIDVDKAQLRVKGSPVQDIIKDGPPSVLGKQFTRFVKPPTGKEKETREADLAAAIAAKEAADQSFQTRVQNLDFAKRMQSGMTEGADLMSKAIDLARLQQLGSVDQNIYGKIGEGDIAKEERRDEILKLLPTALNFAGGGIAKQAGDPSGAMLKSMNPDSQGLSGLLKRAKKI